MKRITCKVKNKVVTESNFVAVLKCKFLYTPSLVSALIC